MKTVTGIWIDHRKAVIVTLMDKEVHSRTVMSHVEKQRGRLDGKRSTTSFESQLVQADDRQQRGFTKHLADFYKEVVSTIGDNQQLLIFGPGEAKGELKKLLEQSCITKKDIVIESADKMTDHQIIARVKQCHSAELHQKNTATVTVTV